MITVDDNQYYVFRCDCDDWSRPPSDDVDRVNGGLDTDLRRMGLMVMEVTCIHSNHKNLKRCGRTWWSSSVCRYYLLVACACQWACVCDRVNNYYSNTNKFYTRFVKRVVFATRCYATAALAVMWCLSVRPCVCLSVTFVDYVKTNKHIFIFFKPLGSKAILFFPYQTAWQ